MSTKVKDNVTDGNKRATFRVSAVLHKRLEALAEREQKATMFTVTTADVVRKCLELGLAQLEKGGTR